MRRGDDPAAACVQPDVVDEPRARAEEHQVAGPQIGRLERDGHRPQDVRRGAAGKLIAGPGIGMVDKSGAVEPALCAALAAPDVRPADLGQGRTHDRSARSGAVGSLQRRRRRMDDGGGRSRRVPVVAASARRSLRLRVARGASERCRTPRRCVRGGFPCRSGSVPVVPLPPDPPGSGAGAGGMCSRSAWTRPRTMSVPAGSPECADVRCSRRPASVSPAPVESARATGSSTTA